jgi:hypothetical protein
MTPQAQPQGKCHGSEKSVFCYCFLKQPNKRKKFTLSSRISLIVNELMKMLQEHNNKQQQSIKHG